MNQQHDPQEKESAGAIRERQMQQDDPLLRYLAGSIDLHGKIRRIHAHQQETASSLLRAAAALRSMAAARQTIKARA